MTVINKYHGVPKGALYIGRGSMWGNPFVIGKDGDRNAVCDKHEKWLWQQIKEGKVTLNELATLHNRDLVCFCAPARCHGHTLECAAKWAIAELAKQSNQTKE